MKKPILTPADYAAIFNDDLRILDGHDPSHRPTRIRPFVVGGLVFVLVCCSVALGFMAGETVGARGCVESEAGR